MNKVKCIYVFISRFRAYIIKIYSYCGGIIWNRRSKREKCMIVEIPIAVRGNWERLRIAHIELNYTAGTDGRDFRDKHSLLWEKGFVSYAALC